MAETIDIGGRVVGGGRPAYLIAEVGQAHEGSLGNALAWIDAAGDSGAARRQGAVLRQGFPGPGEQAGWNPKARGAAAFESASGIRRGEAFREVWEWPFRSERSTA